ncbi:hypothetical protein CDEST_07533 [Colletotrichum destructivum]|uniref:Uncharacterized protein n=1 Tax=Colletotrichum destructivum TaxID=34406 RepID=A0AAX4IGQ5_9PEZI|nr:hypothetical protein CDEST_07533 [Colletotrichum destructivum]
MAVTFLAPPHNPGHGITAVRNKLSMTEPSLHAAQWGNPSHLSKTGRPSNSEHIRLLRWAPPASTGAHPPESHHSGLHIGVSGL